MTACVGFACSRNSNRLSPLPFLHSCKALSVSVYLVFGDQWYSATQLKALSLACLYRSTYLMEFEVGQYQVFLFDTAIIYRV